MVDVGWSVERGRVIKGLTSRSTRSGKKRWMARLEAQKESQMNHFAVTVKVFLGGKFF